MNSGDLKFNVSSELMRGPDTIAIHLYLEGEQGLSVAQPMQFAPLDDVGVQPAPVIRATRAELQALANALWDVGVRPYQAEGSAGQLAATNRHLADMRTIAFAKLNVEAPNGGAR